MRTTTLLRTAGAPAQKLSLGKVLLATVMTALLAASPMFVQSAVAQRPAAIHASAYVTSSVIAVALRTDSARITPRPFTQRLLIAGVGTLDVQMGPGEVVSISPMVEDARNQASVVVQVFNVGS